MNNPPLPTPEMNTFSANPSAPLGEHRSFFAELQREDTMLNDNGEVMHQWNIVLPLEDGASQDADAYNGRKPAKKFKALVDTDEEDEWEQLPTVKLDDVKHTELNYEIQAALDVALMEDGNGTKRKVAIDFANLADDELFSDDEPVVNNTMTDEAEEVEAAPKGQQVKNYCFTWNNPTVDGEELEEKLKNSERVAGYAFQLEEGESGTPHFQGYVQFTNRVRTGAAHKFFEPWRMALIHSKAKIPKKAIDYCIKEEGRLAGPWIGGTCLEKKAGKQGKRTDLDDFAKAVFDAGGMTDEIQEEYHGHTMRFGKLAKEAAAASKVRKAKVEEKEYWKKQYQLKQEGMPITGQQQRRCVLFFGPTAVGKTTEVKMIAYGEYEEELYEKAGNNKWFEGYNGENHVLFDELRKTAFDGSLETFNSMTNIGCVQVEFKGGSTVLQAEHLYFTSNWHPLDIWGCKPNEGRYRAMCRRFDEVYWWNDNKDLLVLKNPFTHRKANEEDQEKAEADWKSFWTGKQIPLEEGMTSEPGMVDEYFTFGCHQ